MRRTGTTWPRWMVARTYVSFARSRLPGSELNHILVCPLQSSQSEETGSSRTIVGYSDDIAIWSAEGEEILSPQVLREAMGPRVVTDVPEGVVARLVQNLGLTGYHLELSVPLTDLEGDAILSSFVPDRAESPEWETGSVENAEPF